MRIVKLHKALTTFALLSLSLSMISSIAHAAEGFKVRFPLNGTLGGEMLAPIKSGAFASLALTHADIDKITGSNGETYVKDFGAYKATVNFKQKVEIVNLILGYTSADKYADGHLSFAVNIPYSALDRNVTGSADPAGTGGAPAAYQNNLNNFLMGASGKADGIGDIEVTGLWLRQTETTKYSLGLTITTPTGSYSKDSKAINAGAGNFYTFRPGASIAYKATEHLTLGARASAAFNTVNKDNDWRSGDFYAVDLAAAYKTPIGIVGSHVLRVEQYKDDVNALSLTGDLGPNRFSSTGAGVFFTTLVPGINAGLNLSYTKTLESKNALSGSFVQARISRLF